MTTYTIRPQELNISTYFEQDGKINIVRSQIWWNDAYSARRNLRITAPPDGLPKNHPITSFIPKNIYDQGKVQSDLRDLEVLYLVSTIPDVWRRLPRAIESVSNYYRVRFLLQEDLAKDESTDLYYVYYANPFRDTVYPLGNPYAYSSSEMDWPLEALYSNPLVSYTRPGEHWSLGESDVRDAKASFQFYGPQVKIIMDKGPGFGIIEVQVDSSDWEEIDLYNSTLLQSQEIFLKGQLGNGVHNIRVKVTGKKNPASTSAKVKLRSFQYKKHSVALDLKEDQYSNYNWSGRIAGV
jgi:hypothetical protein